MSRPTSIPEDVMDVAASIEKDIPSRITGANRVFIRAVIARAILAERELAAKLVRILVTEARKGPTTERDDIWLGLIGHVAEGIEDGIAI